LLVIKQKSGKNKTDVYTCGKNYYEYWNKKNGCDHLITSGAADLTRSQLLVFLNSQKYFIDKQRLQLSHNRIWNNYE